MKEKFDKEVAEIKKRLEEDEKYGITLMNYYNNSQDSRKYMSYKGINVKQNKKTGGESLCSLRIIKDKGFGDNNLFNSLFGRTQYHYL